jgi:hypothetical protein
MAMVQFGRGSLGTSDGSDRFQMQPRTPTGPSANAAFLQDELGGDLGEYNVQRRMQAAKSRMNIGKNKLEESMRQSRALLVAGTLSSQDATIRHFDPAWTDVRGKKPTRNAAFEASQPKYVGQQANELSKWMNADSITRHKEESNPTIPTLRQVLKLDDQIQLSQMTKSQLSSVPYDPTVTTKPQKLPAHAKRRHMESYRPAMKAQAI